MIWQSKIYKILQNIQKNHRIQITCGQFLYPLSKLCPLVLNRPQVQPCTWVDLQAPGWTLNPGDLLGRDQGHNVYHDESRPAPQICTIYRYSAYTFSMLWPKLTHKLLLCPIMHLICPSKYLNGDAINCFFFKGPMPSRVNMTKWSFRGTKCSR